MAGSSLTNTQRNEVLEAIQGAGLSPSDFRWTQRRSEETREPFLIDMLIHVPTNYYFAFDVDLDEGKAWPTIEPGPDGMRTREYAGGGWPHVFGYVQEWVARVKREHEGTGSLGGSEREGELVGDEPEGLREHAL